MNVLQKIVICEDHPIYAKGMQDFLQHHFQVVGNFSTGKETITFLRNNPADLLLLDLNLIDINGLEVVQALQEQQIAIKIIIISMYNDKMLIEKCKKLNIHAYCSKHIVNAELLAILHNVADGVFLVDKSIQKKLQVTTQKENSEDFEKKMNLTAREIELIEFFSKGLSSKEIANELFVSLFTVNTHKKNIYKKLNINSTAELVAFYYENF